MVSVVSVVVTEVVLELTFGVMRLAGVMVCQIIASGVAAAPSYWLNRRWTWGKTGKSGLWSEVVPFWILAFLALAMAIGADRAGAAIARSLGLSHLWVSVVVDFASLVGFGVAWIGRYVILDRLLFADAGHGTLPAEGQGGNGARGDQGARQAATPVERINEVLAAELAVEDSPEETVPAGAPVWINDGRRGSSGDGAQPPGQGGPQGGARRSGPGPP
jgi:putative flippase GtrA